MYECQMPGYIIGGGDHSHAHTHIYTSMQQQKSVTLHGYGLMVNIFFMLILSTTRPPHVIINAMFNDQL